MKEYIRYSGNKQLIPGSSVLRKTKPKFPKYKEIAQQSCCDLNGIWYFLDAYAAPITPGLLDFPDHFNGESSLNPNLVGLIGETAVMLYINAKDDNNIFHPQLAEMFGNSGTLTLTQGINSVTYSFTNQAFNYDEGVTMIFYDTFFGSSVPGSITVISPSSGNFNAIDPIKISVTIS